ncbi:uncharacterized protein L201_004612 [Kwoniella dendrophila CBS 6074]|uniref:Uncharacterized protein n=1 Tax=Kwoniella dendrophila CBS 6074 TaxID=1295534 RepID=A0AAX4JWE1_9TREE
MVSSTAEHNNKENYDSDQDEGLNGDENTILKDKAKIVKNANSQVLGKVQLINWRNSVLPDCWGAGGHMYRSNSVINVNTWLYEKQDHLQMNTQSNYYIIYCVCCGQN